MPEIQDKSRFQAGDFQVIDDLPDMLVSDFLHCLYFDNEAIFNFQVRDLIIDMPPPVIDGIDMSLLERKTSKSECDA
jgi:hypothetical protein